MSTWWAKLQLSLTVITYSYHLQLSLTVINFNQFLRVQYYTAPPIWWSYITNSFDLSGYLLLSLTRFFNFTGSHPISSAIIPANNCSSSSSLPEHWYSSSWSGGAMNKKNSPFNPFNSKQKITSSCWINHFLCQFWEFGNTSRQYHVLADLHNSCSCLMDKLSILYRFKYKHFDNYMSVKLNRCPT